MHFSAEALPGKRTVYKSHVQYVNLDGETVDKIFISNDGLYGVTLPESLDVDNSECWYSNGYVYISSLDCFYRIPCDELTNNIMIILNNSMLQFRTPPVIIDNRTLVPMRFLFEQMGAEVEWNDETQATTAVLNNTDVTFGINNTEAKVNNQPVTMDVPARLINGKTMVPLRFLSEELGYTVTWDEETRTAIIE